MMCIKCPPIPFFLQILIDWLDELIQIITGDMPYLSILDIINGFKFVPKVDDLAKFFLISFFKISNLIIFNFFFINSFA
jgi:hypothetical protein